MGLILAVVAMAGCGTGERADGAPVKQAQPVTALVAFTEGASVTLTLEGCRNDGSIILPINNKFVCPDAAYTTGNLGKGWNELDLVPFRLSSDLGNQTGATTDYDVYIAEDYMTSGHLGYDVISAPVVNLDESDASCTIVAGSQMTQGTATDPFGSGTDTVAYRQLTIHQAKGTTCVFDFNQRLALGSHLYPGSSLQAYLFTQAGLSGSKKTVPLPVNQIAPQEIFKTMQATQDLSHPWTISKEATPAELNFNDTCSTATGALSKNVSIKVNWTKFTATPTGDLNVQVVVSAKNPASRVITVSTTDAVFTGTTALTPSNVTCVSGTCTNGSLACGPVDVAAGATQNLCTLQFTVPQGTTNLNDTVTATYIDKVTNIPVPGTTTLNVPATYLDGTTGNDSATITDIESITSGDFFKYSVNAKSPDGLLSSAAGTYTTGLNFGSSYTFGTLTTDAVKWVSGSQGDSGSATFYKTVTLNGPTQGDGKLHDVASLLGSDGFAPDNAPLDVKIHADALVSITINKTIPNVLQTGESDTFDFSIFDKAALDADPDATPLATKSIAFAAGDTTKSATVSGLSITNGTGSFVVRETGSTSGKWKAQADQTVTITLPSCSGSVTFTNTFAPAHAQARKVTQPAGSEGNWTFTLKKGTATIETKTTTDASYVSFTTDLEEGSYTIEETLKSGWEFVSSSGCSFTVNYPADADKTFSCTYTNMAVTGRIAPTQTTCQNFVTTPDLYTLDSILYGVKGNKINNTAPGVFFYYSYVTAPATGTLTGQITEFMTSTHTNAPWNSSTPPLFQIQQAQIRLYDLNCNILPITIVSTNPANATFTYAGAVKDQRYVVGVKYGTSDGIVGLPVPAPTTVNYKFQTFANGTLTDSNENGLALQKK
ncbi:hypothetical protein [Anaeromyxobacter terrae]|uniref:hypothetical protein n=1 Tax=Anaeromyxobacter terrae TaxID=2925406 RepID=UPI001F569708|nr:hypothetical protein [Anaeromyxobacter sp. SG22]